MATKPTVIFVCGTRPDAIKTAPAVLAFKKRSDRITTRLLSTGQHREMLAQALGSFGLVADDDLDIMTQGQTLAMVTSRALEGLDRVLDEHKPAMVFGQGDTTTTFVAGLAAFYRQIPFGHIEAGLRTETIWNPFPEEFNRRAVGMFAAHHYAPTEWAASNLRKEGVDDASIFVTGNTGIDAVQMISQQAGPDWYREWPGRVVLLTTHRRENWGAPQHQIARAARRLVQAQPDIKLVVAMHRNPVVREALHAELDGVSRVEMIEPPDYAPFVHLMRRSHLILTDSGGVQEEAPSFGVPVLVLRTTTERPEGVDAGTARLVGTIEEEVFTAANDLLSDPAAHAAMSRAVSPYGDGQAGDRIADAALQYLGIPL